MNTDFMNYIYPQIEDEASARRAAKFGSTIAVIIASISLLMLALRLFGGANINGIDVASALIGNVAPMAVVAFFINKMSRIASIAAIAITAAEMFIKFTEQGTVGLTPFFLLVFFNSTRATFAYHKFRRREGN